MHGIQVRPSNELVGHHSPYYSYQRFWHTSEANGHFPMLWPIGLVCVQPKEALPAGPTVITAIPIMSKVDPLPHSSGVRVINFTRHWLFSLSTGAGSGLFLTYATYMTRRDGVVKLGTLLPAANNVIKVLTSFWPQLLVQFSKQTQILVLSGFPTIQSCIDHDQWKETQAVKSANHNADKIPKIDVKCRKTRVLKASGWLMLWWEILKPIKSVREFQDSKRQQLLLQLSAVLTCKRGLWVIFHCIDP